MGETPKVCCVTRTGAKGLDRSAGMVKIPNEMKKAYLAGPTVFMPDAKQRGEELKRICRTYGIEGLFPLDADLDLPQDGLPAVQMIRESCHTMIRRADAVVADLSPFRGPHCDDGTAVEIGIALERGIPIFGYSTDLRSLASRIEHTVGPDALRDAEKIEVENFGQSFNAMIAGALALPAFGSAEKAIAGCAAFLSTAGLTTRSARAPR